MPCGAVDQRRQSHRCSPCRDQHLKCDGECPCSTCLTKGLKCSMQAPLRTKYAIVQYRPCSSIRAPLVQRSWMYTSAFLQATAGSPGRRTPVLDYSLIQPLSQNHDQVHRTLFVVGRVYVLKNPCSFEVPASEQRDCLQSLNVQKSIIRQAMRLFSNQTQGTEAFSALLFCAMILALAELFIDTTGDRWLDWQSQIAVFITQNSGHVDPLNRLQVELVQHFRLSDILGSISRRELPMLPSRPLGRAFPPTGVSSGLQSSLNELLEDLETWAILQYRADQWTGQTSRLLKHWSSTHQQVHQEENGKTQEHQNYLNGLEIVHEATAIQNRIISILFEKKKIESDGRFDFVTAFYHWALGGLSQIFRHPSWSSLQCGLPDMGEKTSLAEAQQIVDYIASRLGKVQIEPAFYMPLTIHVGLEMKDEDDRERVRSVLRKIKAQGFGIADRFLSDLATPWSGHQPSSLNSQVSPIALP